jgi:SAM-dependent methyltransferase
MSTIVTRSSRNSQRSIESLFNDLPGDIERWSLSSFVTAEQVEEWCRSEENDEINQGDENNKRLFLQHKIETRGFRLYARYLQKLNVPLMGRGLEIGAGNFWLSSYLSSFPDVKELVGVELAGARIASFRDVALEMFPGSDRKKIVYAVGDMHAIDRPDNYFDFVACDAVLHHADNLVAVLRECRRCLKPGGWFIAFREPTLSRLSRPPVFDENSPENGSAQYYYPDGWRSAFINGRYTNVKLCPFYEHFQVRGVRFGWAVQPVVRWAMRLAGRYPFPKVCIAAQKPLS